MDEDHLISFTYRCAMRQEVTRIVINIGDSLSVCERSDGDLCILETVCRWRGVHCPEQLI
jgi:hypothetical protein